MLTIEEQERRAYITGNTQLAAALGSVLDADSEEGEMIQMLGERINDLERDLDAAEEELVDLRNRLNI